MTAADPILESPHLAAIVDRFWGFVAVGEPDECWPWKINQTGTYPRFAFGLEPGAMRGHRFSYLIANRELAPVVMHACDNPPCVNPRHLAGGTHVDNVRDAQSKGRLRGGPNAPNKPRARPPVDPDAVVYSSSEAAYMLDMSLEAFNAMWDPTRKGWHIPVGDTKVFVPSIGYTAQKRRVPRARLLEVASYGDTK